MQLILNVFNVSEHPSVLRSLVLSKLDDLIVQLLDLLFLGKSQLAIDVVNAAGLLLEDRALSVSQEL